MQSIDFHQIKSKILPNLVEKMEPTELLEFNKVPSIDQALEIIALPWFKSEIIAFDNLTGINFKLIKNFTANVAEKISGLKIEKSAYILFSFEPSYGKTTSKIFWKMAGREKFYQLESSEDCDKILIEYVKKFIMREIKNRRSGKFTI